MGLRPHPGAYRSDWGRLPPGVLVRSAARSWKYSPCSASPPPRHRPPLGPKAPAAPAARIRSANFHCPDEVSCWTSSARTWLVGAGHDLTGPPTPGSPGERRPRPPTPWGGTQSATARFPEPEGGLGMVLGGWDLLWRTTDGGRHWSTYLWRRLSHGWWEDRGPGELDWTLGASWAGGGCNQLNCAVGAWSCKTGGHTGPARLMALGQWGG